MVTENKLVSRTLEGPFKTNPIRLLSELRNLLIYRYIYVKNLNSIRLHFNHIIKEFLLFLFLIFKVV